MTGKLVVFSGPSAVGKDTLLERWAAQNPSLARVVTYTTRPPRCGEVEGVDYRFVTVEQFRELAEAGKFMEWKEVHGNFYGSPAHDTEAHMADGKIAVLKIDVQGALEVLPKRPDAISIFVLPPSVEELERRIRGRGLDSEEVIQTRLRNARWELSQACEYRFTVVNDDLDRAVRELEGIVS